MEVHNRAFSCRTELLTSKSRKTVFNIENKLLLLLNPIYSTVQKRVLSFLNEMKCPKAFSIKIESIVELLLFVMTKEYWL